VPIKNWNSRRIRKNYERNFSLRSITTKRKFIGGCSTIVYVGRDEGLRILGISYWRMGVGDRECIGRL